jgi:hypothetical protein
MKALARAHGFMRVECPPAPWSAEANDEDLIRVLGEMIAAGLARNGGVLAELTLNVSHVIIDEAAAGPVPAGEFVAITVAGDGDWRPETVLRSGVTQFVTPDLTRAVRAAGVPGAYSRVLSPTCGSVTVLFPRAT